MVTQVLIAFKDPDESFFAVEYGSTGHEYILEEGDEFIAEEQEELDDDQIAEWANDLGYLYEDNEYILEDGTLDYDSLRGKREYDYELELEEGGGSYSSPSNRAFLWFDSKRYKYPSELKIEIVNGAHPGNDWQGVIVKDYNSLVQLQSFLLAKRCKVRFCGMNCEWSKFS